MSSGCEFVVGKEYEVDCVLSCGQWTPVIGPAHTDDTHCLEGPGPHYHIDWRFVETPKVTTVVIAGPLVRNHMKCYRTLLPTLCFPIPMRSMIQKWGKQKMDCKVCPHKGMPLDGLEPDENGHIRCPGHGLRFDPVKKRIAFADRPWYVKAGPARAPWNYPIELRFDDLPTGGMSFDHVEVFESETDILIGTIELKHAIRVVSGDKFTINGAQCKEGDIHAE